MHELEAIRALWRQTQTENQQAVLATVVEVKGSAYRRAGARMLLSENGRSAGMINGGCLDGDLWARARQIFETGQADMACYDTNAPDDIVFGLGLGCRGIVKILLEPVESLDWLAFGSRVETIYEGEKRGTRALGGSQEAGKGAFVQTIEAAQRMLLFGAGQDAVPLQAMAKMAGFEVEVFDNRAPSPARHPLLESRYFPIEQLGGELGITPDTACVIMTHNFLFDLELLKLLLPSQASYVGILGPRRRTDELLDKLGEETLLPPVHLAESDLEKLHAPVGLDLGAETPEEIALSIVAEIQKVKRAKSGSSLRDLKKIH